MKKYLKMPSAALVVGTSLRLTTLYHFDINNVQQLNTIYGICCLNDCLPEVTSVSAYGTLSFVRVSKNGLFHPV